MYFFCIWSCICTLAKTITHKVQKFDGCLWQSATPDKTSVNIVTSEHDVKFTPQKSSPAERTILSSSAEQSASRQSLKSSTSKRLPSSAAKRLQYTTSPGSEKVNGSTPLDVLQPTTETLTTATERCPRSNMNDTSNCSGSRDLFPDGTLEVDSKSSVASRSPKVASTSPKVVGKSPKVVNSSPKVNRSPGQRQSVNGGCVKRGSLESPTGQPRTKKFIVERLRNAKTSRKKPIDVHNKSSPGRKSPQKKYIGKLHLC